MYKNTVIPDGVKRIGNYALAGIDLSFIEIPNSVTFIGQGAFANTKLKTITIPINVDTICAYAFDGDSLLKSIVWNAKYAEFLNSQAFADIKCPTCPPEHIFNAPNVSSLTIGEDVEDFSEWAASVFSEIGTNNEDTLIPLSIIWNSKENKFNPMTRSPFSYLLHISTVTFGNKVKEIPYNLFAWAERNGHITPDEYDKITSIVIPNNVTFIGSYAFQDCTNLKSIIIGSGVNEIGKYAFIVGNENELNSMTCYAVEPPSTPDGDITIGLDTIYVPAESVNAYKAADIWKTYTILPIGAKGTVTNELQVTPATDYADIIWPAISGAASYELVIKDTHGNTICTLVFNAAGQLASIVFHAPTHNSLSQNQQTTGFSFSVMGLQPGTTYNATITAKDKNGNTLDVKNISFTTEGDAPQSLDQITNAPSQVTNKILHNGTFYILRGDKTYTVTGQEVK